MSESSVRILTEIEARALIEYTKLTRDAAAATRDLHAAQQELSGGGGGAGGAGGGPGGGSPPPPPPTHPTVAAARQHGVAVPTGAPPALPPQGAVFSPTAVGQAPPAASWEPRVPGRPPPPPPPGAPSSPFGAMVDSGLDWLRGHEEDGIEEGVSAGGSGKRRRRRRNPHSIRTMPWDPMSQHIQHFMDNPVMATASGLYRAADTAATVALGTSMTNFPFAALDTYVQLTKVLTQLDAKFRETDGSATRFASTLGYTIARGGQLAEALGSTTNQIGARDRYGEKDDFATRYLGFSRATGADPERALRSLGTLTSLGGETLGGGDLYAMLGAAKTVNMHEGRFDEFLGLVEQQARDQFAATGEMHVSPTLNAVQLGAFVHGAGTARAENDRTLAPQVNAMFNSKGPMRAYMMRALGYGQGTMSKRELDMRLEAGLYDDRNIQALMGSLIQRGVTENDMYEAVLPYFDKAWQADAFVKAFGTQEKLDSYLGRDPGDLAGLGAHELMDRMTPAQARQFQARTSAGEDPMTVLGQMKISLGEGVEARREAWQMNMGGELAKSLPALMDTMGNLGTILQNLLTMFGQERWGDSLARIAGRGADLTAQGVTNSAAMAKEGMLWYNLRKYEELGTLIMNGVRPDAAFLQTFGSDAAAGSGGR